MQGVPPCTPAFAASSTFPLHFSSARFLVVQNCQTRELSHVLPFTLLLTYLPRPRLVVSGHMHGAHGVAEGVDMCNGVTFVNAAICRDGYSAGWDPVVIEI